MMVVFLGSFPETTLIYRERVVLPASSRSLSTAYVGIGLWTRAMFLMDTVNGMLWAKTATHR